MRTTLATLLFLSACSNAADPATPDAPSSDSTSLSDAAPDVGPPLDILRINEVAATGTPSDWFEIVNVSSAAVELSEYCYVDTGDDFAKCKPFDAQSLAPNTHVAQDVNDTVSGFGLGGDEELFVFRIADQRLSDTVDWNEGDAPANESYARIPDITGSFARTNQPTRGAANVADNPTAPLLALVINEVAAGETPDWIEVVNATGAPIDLSLYCYGDSGTVCHPFATTPTMLASGAYHAADASQALTMFAYGGDELAVVRRISDGRLSDTVDWNTDQAGPAGTSFARFPNVTGTFMSTTNQTRGNPNPASP